MRRADSWKHADDIRASHAPAFEACGPASTRPRARGRHTCTDNRQHTRHPHGRSAAAPIGHQSEPQIFPARSISQASAQFLVRDPTVEREGPVVPLYGTYDCWQPQSTPLTQPIVMPVHPTNIPLAPMYPPDFDFPTTSVIDTPTP
eukprot:scaffold6347_cov124-Isochrysis_galbana.AAC.6